MANVPPFPWDNLKALLFMNGFFSSDTTVKPIAAGGTRGDGIRAPSINAPERSLVIQAISRAFNDNAARHKMYSTHWNVFLACELGIVRKLARVQEGRKQYALMPYSVDHPAAVMPDLEASAAFGITPDRVRRYHNAARKAVEDEWEYIYSGYEEIRDV